MGWEDRSAIGLDFIDKLAKEFEIQLK